MSKAATSPTARLLQSSRLFSLPRPLPPPPLSALESTGVFRASPTATEPYPTHQAIATPASSLSRGDWGLKRPLPGKKLGTSQPSVRVRAQDTPEHITDFGSAGDHVHTERKWAELGVPMVMQPEKGKSGAFGERTAPVSVFEDWLDNTSPTSNTTSRGETSQRWKSTGPWLGGMQEGEFRTYLNRTLSTPQMKRKWLSFLREKQTQDRLRDIQRRAREEGKALSASQLDELKPDVTPTDEELTDISKRLRDAYSADALSSDLTSLIAEFLDLPNVFSTPSTTRTSNNDRLLNRMIDFTAAEKGPPTTHPSAGLSHLRTNAIMPNHPIYGPQTHRAPVQARVVRPRTSAGARLDHQAKIGVAGIVTNDPQSATSPHTQPREKENRDPAHAIVPEIQGGGKIWVHAETAWVDEKGRIQLAVSRGDREAVAVKTGEDLDEIIRNKRKSFEGGAAVAREFSAMPVFPSPGPRTGAQDKWGLGNR